MPNMKVRPKTISAMRRKSRRFAPPKRHAHLSEPRKVTWHLPFELGEVARDRGHVEASEDRFLGLAVEQEPEGRLDAAFWRMLARRQPLAHLSRHRDVVTSLALSFADDHLENERVALGSAPDLDHVDLLGDARVLKGPQTQFPWQMATYSLLAGSAANRHR